MIFLVIKYLYLKYSLKHNDYQYMKIISLFIEEESYMKAIKNVIRVNKGASIERDRNY